MLWLEDWLTRYPGTLLLVTHDRDFLDAVAHAIVHVDGRKLTRLHRQLLGVRARARRAARAAAGARTRSSSAQIAHLQSFVDRFRAKATKAQAGAEPPQDARAHGAHRRRRTSTARSTSRSRRAGTHARQLVRLEHATLGYGDARRCSTALELSILRRRRASACSAPTARASRRWSRRSPASCRSRTASAHGAQDLRDRLLRAAPARAAATPTASPMLHLARLDPGAREQELRDFLGGFDFRGDMVDAPVARFSGGEKARLALALIVRAAPATCCCSTSRPTTSTSRCARRSPRRCRTSTARSWWSRTTATCSPRRPTRCCSSPTAASRRSTATSTTTATGCCRGPPHDRRTTTRRARARPIARRSSAPRPRRGRSGPTHASRSSRASRSSKPRCARSRTRRSRLDRWLATPEAYADDAKEKLKPAIERAGEITWELARREAAWLELAEALDKIDAPG